MDETYRGQKVAEGLVWTMLTRLRCRCIFTPGQSFALADIWGNNPNGKMFQVDVKSQAKRNNFPIGRKPLQERLFYILVFQPLTAPEFFIFTQEAIDKIIDEELIRLGRPIDYSMRGLPYKLALDAKDRWEQITE